jgi:hypothetical protein
VCKVKGKGFSGFQSCSLTPRLCVYIKKAEGGGSTAPSVYMVMREKESIGKGKSERRRNSCDKVRKGAPQRHVFQRKSRDNPHCVDSNVF